MNEVFWLEGNEKAVKRVLEVAQASIANGATGTITFTPNTPLLNGCIKLSEIAISYIGNTTYAVTADNQQVFDSSALPPNDFDAPVDAFIVPVKFTNSLVVTIANASGATQLYNLRLRGIEVAGGV